MTTPTTSPSELVSPTPGRRRRGLPVLLAVAVGAALWQLVVLTGWRPDYLLPGPLTVLATLGELSTQPSFWQAIGRTLSRALLGFGLAVIVGTLIGLAAASSTLLREAVGSLVTGLQTMPSVVWFPLAILLLGLGEEAIGLVVVLGAAPSIANGVLTGVDQVPPAFFRLGHVLGARGWALQRHVVLPAALPSYVGGLNQGWAFAWRSLMAGELLVTIPGAAGLGNRLAFAQEFGDAAGLLAHMVVVLALGMLADAVFATLGRRLRAQRGLVAP